MLNFKFIVTTKDILPPIALGIEALSELFLFVVA
ncbi:MAG: hypothetical protein RIQ70_146 [Bacteroidota bacterium]|jgi:hypothetical protein